MLLSGCLEAAFGLQVDGWFGLGVALFILYSGAALARDTISPLLGENASPELKNRIATMNLSTKWNGSVCGIWESIL